MFLDASIDLTSDLAVTGVQKMNEVSLRYLRKNKESTPTFTKVNALRWCEEGDESGQNYEDEEQAQGRTLRMLKTQTLSSPNLACISRKGTNLMKIVRQDWLSESSRLGIRTTNPQRSPRRTRLRSCLPACHRGSGSAERKVADQPET